MADFLIYALLAGCSVAMLAGPLGCFAVWRRMAYFGDTLAHSALTGVALGLILSVNVSLAIVLFSLLLALALVALQHNSSLASDTLLGILSHAMLATGLVLVALFGRGRVDLYAYLFGDLLAVTPADLFTIAAVAAVIIPGLIAIWRPLLSLTVHEELAQVEGVAVVRTKLLLMLMMALLVAVAMKVVGVMLVTALLIIPAAASRRLARSPEQMAIGASLIGMTAVIGGVASSFVWDTPAGPSAVICAALAFGLSLLRPMPA